MQRGRAQAVGDPTGPQQLEHLGPGEPLDTFGLGDVGRIAAVLRILGQEEVEPLVAQSVGGVVADERADRGRLPAGLLQHLASGALLGRLVRVGSAGRDLPSPGVGDESMAPEQQNLVLALDDDAGRRRRHADDVMVEATDAGDVDVDQRHVEPRALVDGSLAVHGPLHGWAP